MSRRTEKVNDLVQSVVADLLRRRVKDPALADAIVSLTRVEVSPDLSTARVHVSVLGDEAEQDSVLQALERTEPFLHREMARELHMRRVPRLTFLADHSLEDGDRITQMMRDVARGEGRDF
jgi:ribosome-binding factor A